MRRYTLSELQAMPTIEQGHTDDLKVVLNKRHHPGFKIWLSRLTVADGVSWDNMVAVEEFDPNSGCWLTVDTYPAL